MAILQEILEWTQGIPAWQSDVVSRLLAKQTLTPQDHEDLYALLKLAHGIPDPKNRQSKPLTADQIPAQVKATTHIELRAIKNLHNVNAIAENQQLTVGPAGMTVIYGDNGSGKSGYSRVLKRACRARDQSEPIHPNANLPGAKAGNAQASFDIAIDGTAKEVVWQQGKEAPPELSSFAIFDARCARAYLDNEDDFSYVPYGLDVFEALAKVCQQLKTSIETEQKQSAVDLAAFAHLQGETAVGKLISVLSAKTTTAQIEALAVLKPEELEQREMLEKSLKENNPKEKAGLLRLRARRIAAIAKNATEKGLIVGPEAIVKLKALADAFRTAQAAAALAAKNFKDGENLLPGTGGEVWRELFDAARKFALEAHPDKQFPDLGVDAACPLCQQPLAAGAERLMRFEAFIQAEAEKTAQARRQALAVEYRPFAASVMTLSLDEATQTELGQIDQPLVADTKAFEAALTIRHEAIKAAVVSHDWTGLDQALVSPADRLQALADKLNVEAEALEKASNEEARAALQKQLGELDARVKLSQVKEAVVSAVEKLGHQGKLKNCLTAVRTNAISIKASELAEKVVSKDLADALNREFKTLGVGSLSVSLQSRADRGKALHKLKLQLPQVRSPGEILSEGEQRAIAIGSFLAEVGLSGSKGGIVFDDPVSSLDHRRRERVAKRLATEAVQRQVIIFTHDIYFLCLLAEEAKQAGATVVTQSLTRRAEGFGIADPELPFEGKNASKRIGALKAQQQVIAKLYKEGNEQEHLRQTVDAYFRLRMAWERAVEEVLLREVILRFRKGVETQRLVGVSVDDDDYAQVNAGMSRCSNYAHDKAMMGGVAVPDPDELLEDILALESWRALVHKRSEETAKKRKAGPPVAAGAGMQGAPA
ncbi:AAA family ATPase [Dickeya dianthicola]|uniref:AAA family ATPase n=1 Tax=Dickeya dianthicola TaxID=204039 RepID=UPI0003A26B92|nr:AAA family ATPase [Dickeya dianthicola]MCI4029472.1 AAA family ATPase [Dickeya dianthicola]MCI4174772.1 AAA family ATPase [Dickeya dianthicola]MCI4175753.1 AAA family ATPase [Dickeya dianthicola]MCI4181664.1 AAA family ATPase [Dickeya dianthicola]MCI4196219.1 AAA family ATPase [Dickeya dianthicola]